MNIKWNMCNYESNNEFVVEEQAVISIEDELLQSRKLVGLSTISLSVIPIDQTTKHNLLTSNGYAMAISGDTGNLVCTSNTHIIIINVT